jgi:tetratricopeptide (TPR) repeat protein
MRTVWLWGALFAGWLTACDLGTTPPGVPPVAPGAETAAAVASTPIPSAPGAKAPTAVETLRSCALPEPDFAGLRARLAEGAFEPLDAAYDAILEAYSRQPACEGYLWMATRNLADEDFALLDRWVAARPDSWGAATARGARWVDTGYARRGVRRSSDVTGAQWVGMREAFAHADRDLQRALEIEPGDFVAYGYSIVRLKSEGDASQITRWLDALVARDPLNVGVRKRAIEALSPRWGGSLEVMRALAEDAQQFAGQNPRLRLLPGLAVAEVAKGAHDRKQYAKAVEVYREALEISDERDWYDALSHNLDHLSDWAVLEATARHWIEVAGDDAAARFYLGKALVQSQQVAASLEHFDRAHALWPKNAEYLRWRGYARTQAGQVAGAADDLRRSLELQPGDAWASAQLAEIGSGAKANTPVAAMPADAGSPPPAQGERTLPGVSRL